MKTISRRSWKRMLWSLLAGGLLLVALGVLWIWFKGRDLPPPEVADLIVPQTIVVAEEDNGFVWLNRALEALVWPDGAGADRDKVARALPENAEALRLVRVALSCDVSVNPDQGGYGFLGASYKVHYLGLLLGAEARASSAAGKREAARQAVVDGLRLAALLLREPSGMMERMFGDVVLADALAEARWLASDPQVTAGDLEAVLAAVRELPSPESSMRRALLGEFAMAEARLALMEELFSDDESPGLGPSWLTEGPHRVLLRRYRFQPNRTRQMLAELIRVALRDMALPEDAPEIRLPARPPIIPDNTLILPDPPAPPVIALLTRANAVGELQFAAAAGMIGWPRHYRIESEKRWAGTLLVVALRLHEIQTGRLPDSLDELVSGYLDAVPRSPFDGRPFRYTPAWRIVHTTDSLCPCGECENDPDAFYDEESFFDPDPFPNENHLFYIGPRPSDPER